MAISSKFDYVDLCLIVFNFVMPQGRPNTPGAPRIGRPDSCTGSQQGRLLVTDREEESFAAESTALQPSERRGNPSAPPLRA